MRDWLYSFALLTPLESKIVKLKKLNKTEFSMLVCDSCILGIFALALVMIADVVVALLDT